MTEDDTIEEAPKKRKSSETRLGRTVRYFYDLQKLRIQSGNRGGSETAELEEPEKEFLTRTGVGLESLEKETLKEIKALLKKDPIFKGWLEEQRGVGPTMAGVLLAHLHPSRFETASKMWRMGGLACIDGKAERRVKGQRAHFDPWLKAKLVKVLAESFIKSKSPWREFYDNYKLRKQSMRISCMACAGVGQAVYEGKKQKCANCDGTGTGPWGKSDAHRHVASLRYMTKMFLVAYYKEGRTILGLPVRPSYQEEYLGKVHTG